MGDAVEWDPPATPVCYTIDVLLDVNDYPTAYARSVDGPTWQGVEWWKSRQNTILNLLWDWCENSAHLLTFRYLHDAIRWAQAAGQKAIDSESNCRFRVVEAMLGTVKYEAGCLYNDGGQLYESSPEYPDR